ncbi:glutamate carboxypeptidase like protein [Verticillium longisporum]|uniref:Glutamate carboxypeptidase like protein n=1 Tax=Verticillium longisporum TaxID=100787 RepID=A0A8I2ZM22_VERLO|nr:glutamate carboxypeptidase like protein [Verticillium longisporum]
MLVDHPKRHHVPILSRYCITLTNSTLRKTIRPTARFSTSHRGLLQDSHPSFTVWHPPGIVMADEHTPLIATVLVAEPRQRYQHHYVRRLCTTAICACLFAFFTTFVVLVCLDPDDGSSYFPGPPSGPAHSTAQTGPNFSHQDLLDVLFETPSAEKAEDWSRYYTAGPHLAGQNFSQARWTQERWIEWGVPSDIVSYDVYLNYPVNHSLSVLSREEKDSNAQDAPWKVDFKASLEEDILNEDPTSGSADRIPTFHGYSASGNVTGSFVWVNYGTYQDFEDLRKANISLAGKIAIARYGGIFRGLKIKRAQELGMVGAVLYSDPGDDGEIREENGYKTYPEGPARNPSSVQRGSAQFLSVRPGDPTTPGYPSKPGAPRAPVDAAIPSIPSIPISYADALPILRALNGHGPSADDFNQYWTRNLGLKYKGIEYNIGPSPDNVVINLYNEQSYVTTPLWNVIGIVNGTIPNEVVVIGNHRDAWIAGGAGDPNSGSAVLNEVVRSVGAALAAGWTPLRTIVFASWDGEEYSLIGSTEWVEEYLPWLTDAAVAYVNVDVGVRSANFDAAAAPLLHRVLREVVAAIPSPNQTVPGQTVGDLWSGKIRPMGSGSDFTAFQDFAGIPSLDFGFGGYGPKDAVYHYHSNYDSFYWMENFGDPGFEYHKAMARILGRTVAELSNKPIIRFDATDYADALAGYIDKIDAKLAAATSSAEPDIATMSEEEIFALRSSGLPSGVEAAEIRPRGSSADVAEALAHLRFLTANLRIKTKRLDALGRWVDDAIAAGVPWWRVWKRLKLGWALVHVNAAYKGFERHFLHPEGLDGRDWFKHVVFAPGLWTGYAGAVFPGLQESIDARDYVNAVRWAGIIGESLESADKSI